MYIFKVFLGHLFLIFWEFCLVLYLIFKLGYLFPWRLGDIFLLLFWVLCMFWVLTLCQMSDIRVEGTGKTRFLTTSPGSGSNPLSSCRSVYCVPTCSFHLESVQILCKHLVELCPSSEARSSAHTVGSSSGSVTGVSVGSWVRLPVGTKHWAHAQRPWLLSFVFINPVATPEPMIAKNIFSLSNPPFPNKQPWIHLLSPQFSVLASESSADLPRDPVSPLSAQPASLRLITLSFCILFFFWYFLCSSKTNRNTTFKPAGLILIS